MADPLEHERCYYRSKTTGELGYLVRRLNDDGKEVDHIRLDRGMSETSIRPFNPANWIAEEEHRPVSRMRTAELAFATDKKLCQILGLHLESRKEWGALRDEERIAFLENGPPKSNLKRRQMWRAVMKVMEDMTEKP